MNIYCSLLDLCTILLIDTASNYQNCSEIIILKKFWIKNTSNTFGCIYKYIHTQLVITTLQAGLRPSVSNNLYLCVLILCISGGVFRFKPTADNRFLRSFSWQILFTLTVFCQKSAASKSPKKYCFLLVKVA